MLLWKYIFILAVVFQKKNKNAVVGLKKKLLSIWLIRFAATLGMTVLADGDYSRQ
jgi:hypothetical protein